MLPVAPVRSPRALWRAAVAVAFAVAVPAAARAQAYGNPSFQPPTVTSREYNFGVAGVGNGGGSALIFQWREGMSVDNQLSFEGGFASPSGEGADAALFVGGQFAHQLARSTADVPFDMLFTLGAGIAFNGDFSVLQVPVGLSIGHRFPLEGGMAITPYAHPRVAIVGCSGCGDDNSALGVSFDLGGNFEINRQFALRASTKVGSNAYLSGNSFGLSLAWTPPGIARR
jgi:hypothetical protein